MPSLQNCFQRPRVRPRYTSGGNILLHCCKLGIILFLISPTTKAFQNRNKVLLTPETNVRNNKATKTRKRTTNAASSSVEYEQSLIRKKSIKQSASMALSLSRSGGENDDNKSQSTTTTTSLRKKMIAEAIGTFLIVHLGCGVVCSTIYYSSTNGLFQIAAIWGIAVTVAIYCTAHISGAHLNPAISVAMALLRGDSQDEADGFSWKKVVPYVSAQVAGSFLGGLVNFGLFRQAILDFESKEAIVRGTLDSVKSAAAFGEYWSVGNWQSALLVETIGTAILSLVIFSVTHHRNEESIPPNAAPILIGGTVSCLISVLAPMTQAGFNPARDFGPRIVTFLFGWGKQVSFRGWWVYVLGPVLGAVLGGALSEKVLFAE